VVNQRLTAHEFTGVNLGGIPSFGSKKNPPAETGGLALVRHILLFIRAADPVAAINRHWIEEGEGQALTIIVHAGSFEVSSADGQTVRRFPFDENVSTRFCWERCGFDCPGH
jgi:hypothetical protein